MMCGRINASLMWKRPKSISTSSPSGANVGTDWPDTGLFVCSETVSRFSASSSVSPDLVGLLP